jgi:hypothetical protein
MIVAAVMAACTMVVLPATASADALVWNNAPCVAYANGGASFYSGSGTEVGTPSGGFKLSCNLELVSGPGVTEATTTTYENCRLLQVPSGRAELTCRTQL